MPGNEQRIVLKADQDKRDFLKTWHPSVRFQIPSDLRQDEYLRWLTVLFADFIRSLSSHRLNANFANRLYFSSVGEESGVGGINIGDEEFDSCKLFVYDGESPSNVWDWKGVLMTDHFDKCSKVKPIYKLAEKFEAFLNNRQVQHQRFGILVGASEDTEQVTE